MTSIRKEYSYGGTLIVALLCVSLLRVLYILYGPLDLSPDETLYWDCTRRLDLSYYSKGPLIVYLMYVSTALFGSNAFAIRVMAVVFYFLSSLVLYKLVLSLYDSRPLSLEDKPYYSDVRFIALVCVLLFQIIPLFATYAIVFTIDSPFVFFWILSLYLFWKALNTSEGHSDWILLGISIGLGMQAKYIMAMFIACAFAFMLLTQYRPVLKTIKPYAAFIVSMAVFSPVIIWNMRHDWVTLKHTAGHAHLSDGLKIAPMSLLEFLGSQLGVVTPVLFVLICIALFKLRGDGLKKQGFFLLCFSVPIFSFFLFKSVQGKVQANWPMTGYITGVIAFVRYFFYAERKESLKLTGKHTKRAVIIGILIAILVVTAGLYPSLLGIPPQVDPASRLRGWKVLGDEVGRLYGGLAGKGDVLIFSDKYQITSELAFYVKGNPITYCINLGRRMNEYDIWPNLNEAADHIRQNKSSHKQINAIFITDGNGSLPQPVGAAFDRCDKQLFEVYENQIVLRMYSIFTCLDFKRIQDETPQTY
ncbi:MAG: glycosyltransferase family 39 protein [Nitrospirae bacterium]|nr:glycosyltransferase family 39 protein [Nitrospirota bacterium]